jgi:hypothetical protein
MWRGFFDKLLSPIAAHGSYRLRRVSCGVWQCCLGNTNLSAAVVPDPVKLPLIRSRLVPAPPLPEKVPSERIVAGGIAYSFLPDPKIASPPPP